MSTLADSFELVEVAPRDGLQNESAFVATADKVELVQRVLDSGVRRVEVTSFVHPERVPQLKDAEAVMAALPRPEGVSYSGLVLNDRGLDRAVAAGVDEINMVVVVSETFSQRNQGMSTADGLRVWAHVAERAREAGVMPAVTLAAAFGCPFEGEVPMSRVAAVLDEVAAAGPTEISLADTIGVAVPTQIADGLGLVAETAPHSARRLHLHNTRNTGLANAHAGLQHGATVLDASVGGIGGCPFAPGATGNIATEDLLYLAHRMGVDSGVRLEELLPVATWIGDVLDMQPPGLLSRAGMFP